MIYHIMEIKLLQVMVDLILAIMMGTVVYFNLVNIICLFHMVIDLVSSIIVVVEIMLVIVYLMEGLIVVSIS